MSDNFLISGCLGLLISGDVLFELSVEMAAVTAEIASRIDRNIPEGAGRSVSPNDSQVAM